MRSLIVFAMSIAMTFQPSAGAMTLAQQNKVKEFFERTELTTKEVPLNEFVTKVSPGLSKNVLQELQSFSAQNPGLVLPKFNVSKVIGKNGQQEIQVSFVGKDRKGKAIGSMSFQIIGKGQVFAKVGDSEVKFDDMKSMATVMAKINQGLDPNYKPGYKTKNYGLLTAKNVSRLSLDEKRKYFKGLRELLGTLETLENQKIDRKPAKTSSLDPRSYFISQLLKTAEAKAQLSYNAEAVGSIKVGSSANSCIYAGYVTNYGYKADGAVYNAATDKKAGHYACGGAESDFQLEANKCRSATGAIRCNPDVYGADPEVCAKEHSRSATLECNAIATKFDAFPKADLKDKNSAGFDKLREQVIAKLKVQEAACAEIAKDKKDRLEDQKATCDNLTQRIEEIKNVTCDALQASPKGKFTDLQCSGSPAPTIPVGAGAPPDTSNDICKVDRSPAPAGPGGIDGPKQGAGPVAPPQASSAPPASASPTVPCRPPQVGGADAKPPVVAEPVSSAPGDCNGGDFSKDKGFIAAVESDCIKTGGKVIECIDLKSADKTKAIKCQCDKPAATTYAGVGLAYFCAGSPGDNSAGTDGKGGSSGGRSSKSTKSSEWTKPLLIFGGGLLALIIGDQIFKSNNPAPSTAAPADWAPSTTTITPHLRPGTQ